MYSYVDDSTATARLPHSDICALSLICSYTQLFAACRVLLRLPMPRHSPYALIRLTLRYVNDFFVTHILFLMFKIFVYSVFVPYAIFNELFFSFLRLNACHFFLKK